MRWQSRPSPTAVGSETQAFIGDLSIYAGFVAKHLIDIRAADFHDQGDGGRGCSPRDGAPTTARGRRTGRTGQRTISRSRRGMALTFLVDTSVIKRLDQPAVRQAVHRE